MTTNHFISLAIILLFNLNGQSLFAQNVTTLITDTENTYEAIHWHPDGRIYAADFNNGRVLQLSLDGTVETLVTGIPNIAGGGFDEQGQFYFSGLATGDVYRLESDGSTTRIANGLNQPTGITALNADTLLVGQYGNNSIAKVAIGTGTVQQWVSGGGINGPDAIIRYNDTSFLVANFNNTQIHLVEVTGEVTDFATLPIGGFMGYITLLNNEVFVPAFSGSRVYKIAADGAVSVLAGSGSTGHVDGTGQMAQFTQPNGIAHSPNGDTLLVTDENRVRIITDFGSGPVSTIENNLPGTFQVLANPIQDLLQINFTLPKSATLHGVIYTSDGRQVTTINTATYGSGNHQIQVDTGDWITGIYWLKISNEQGQYQTVSFSKSS